MLMSFPLLKTCKVSTETMRSPVDRFLDFLLFLMGIALSSGLAFFLIFVCLVLWTNYTIAGL